MVVVLWHPSRSRFTHEALLFFACVSPRLKHEQMRMRVCIGRIAAKDMAVSCRVDDKLSHKLNTSGMKMHYPATSCVGCQRIEGRDSIRKIKKDRDRRRERAKRISRFLCAAIICRDSVVTLHPTSRWCFPLSSLWLNHQSLSPSRCSIHLVITELWKEYINMLKVLKSK